jgi:predicted lysophospholipase L1 biosynthesis ABC-type transport system permease subunit
MRSFILFLICASVILALAPIRAWAVVHLMTHYRVDEYLSNPKARRFYIFNIGGGIVTAALVVVAAYTSHVWWVIAAAWIFFAFVGYRIGTKLRMRLDGSYREFYKAAQWR